MNLLPVKAVALLSAVLLALPVGWCCGEWQPQDRADAASHSACLACSQHFPADANSAPSKPRTDCTCDLQTAALLKQSVRVLAGDLDGLDGVAAVHTGPVSVWREPGERLITLPEPAGSRAGPPLHVLKCVWRC